MVGSCPPARGCPCVRAAADEPYPWWPSRPSEADVHVILVVPSALDHAGWPPEAIGPVDDHLHGTSGEEAIQQILREPAVDFGNRFRRTLRPVAPRVEHVDLEPVSMVAGCQTAHGSLSARPAVDDGPAVWPLPRYSCGN